ncbi:hypothetical protein DDE18_00710 [Nocardioides gansuensis]|uniref:CHRD domain-containing protein n=1 Tax=Nocardioides gansuensis TaxID=2138300 RepID=A0A2T8FES5_9ACTN|nr:CHRD domain-containing protein [Nocardioides gansuensis]PVG84197.1 hypothetical protein DDE18_00710 [Nocardioides gansuensis]
MIRPTLAATLALTLLSPTAVLAAADAAPAVERRAATVLMAHLHGDDPDGTGMATLRLAPARGRVCARITWSDIDKPTAAHVHRVSDGSVVVDLTGAVTGGSRCTTGVSARTVRRIARRPGRFYVNVHTAAYPGGAISGRLHR